MKKLSFAAIVFIALMLPVMVFAADGTVTQTPAVISDLVRTITFVCTGGTAGETGTIPDTATDADNTAFIKGWYPFRVIIKNAAADANVDNDADIYLKDADETDILDGQGVDQLDDSTVNYIRLNQYDVVTGALTLSAANQTAASGVWTVTVIFVK